MNPKYEIGQRVLIKPVNEPISRRESDIDDYAGQVGEVSNFYWMSPPSGKLFYIYTVLAGIDKKEIILYEDEMEPCFS
jgi:hypothetical protein